MKRRLLQLCFVLGLLLTLAVAAAWARSFWIAERLTISRAWFDRDDHYMGALVSLDVENRVFMLQ